MEILSGIRRHALLILILPLAFTVYSISFNDIPALRQSSVLGMSDAAYHQIVMEDFQLSRTYGNEYAIEGRNNSDRAQKHKIHHVLYFMVGGALYTVLINLFALVGISSTQALFTINAIIGCCNIALLYVLLRHFNPKNRYLPLYLLIYAFSLSTWMYCSALETWPFSALLTMLFLYLLYLRQHNKYMMSIWLGIFMLNNIFLGFLSMFLAIAYLKDSGDMVAAIKKTAVSVILTISTWFASLTTLSLFDSSLAPWNFIRVTLWFKRVIVYDVSIFDPYAWKAILTNLFVTSVISNQSNANMPPEALLYTFKESRLGTVATIVFLILLLIAGVRMLMFIKEKMSRGKIVDDVVDEYEWHLMLYCLGWIGICAVVMPTASLMYSTVVLPAYIMIVCRFLDLEKRYIRIMLQVTVVLLLVNNTVQILRFRETLSALN